MSFLSALQLYILGVLLMFWLILILERRLIWASLVFLLLLVLEVWMFNAISNFLLIGFLLQIFLIFIVFQDELKYFFRSPALVKKQDYTSVAQAIKDFLSYAVKEGLEGILVFKRKHSLESFVKAGKAIKAKVDPLLLAQFFARSSAFKGKAIIIEGRDIKAVDCVLSGRAGPKYLSEKQRAGLALSQTLDALIVVFEKGVVEIFLEGQRVKVTPERVEAILKTAVGKKKIRLK